MTPIEAIALAILNSDRIAAGLPPVDSRDNIPDSEGYARNARAALTALESNISDAMVEAALRGRDGTLPAAVAKDVFTAMLRAAREQG